MQPKVIPPLRTQAESIIVEAARWRESLRGLHLVCACERGFHGAEHEPGCAWEYAVMRLYELERMIEGIAWN